MADQANLIPVDSYSENGDYADVGIYEDEDGNDSH